MKKYLLILFLINVSVFVFAEERNALLIANGKYKSFSGLSNPIPEAEGLKESLIKLGFDVKLVSNANKDRMEFEISEFQKKLRKSNGIGFFHYGGHAVQVKGENYLIPVDAEIPNENLVSYRAINVNEVMSSMVAETNIIVFDSCRNNPLPGSAGRSAVRGLQVVKVKPRSSIVICSASTGEVAKDGVFTPILSKKLLENKEIHSILRDVRNEVNKQTGGQQIPVDYDQLFSDVHLAKDLSTRMVESEAKKGQNLDVKLAQLKNNEKVKNDDVDRALLEKEANRKRFEEEQNRKAEEYRRMQAQRKLDENAQKNMSEKIQADIIAKMTAEHAEKLARIEQKQQNAEKISQVVAQCNEILQSINDIINNLNTAKNNTLTETKNIYQNKQNAVNKLVIDPWEKNSEFLERKDNLRRKLKKEEEEELKNIEEKCNKQITNDTSNLWNRLHEKEKRIVTVIGKRMKVVFGEYNREQQFFPVTVSDTLNASIIANLKLSIYSTTSEERNVKYQEVNNLMKTNGYVGFATFGVMYNLAKSKYQLRGLSVGLKKVSNDSVVVEKFF